MFDTGFHKYLTNTKCLSTLFSKLKKNFIQPNFSRFRKDSNDILVCVFQASLPPPHLLTNQWRTSSSNQTARLISPPRACAWHGRTYESSQSRQNCTHSCAGWARRAMQTVRGARSMPMGTTTTACWDRGRVAREQGQHLAPTHPAGMRR